jgi:hypothetical protein
MGIGGQNVKMDLEKSLAFAYITNGMKAGSGEHVKTFNRLETSLYRCLRHLESNEEAKTD